MPELNSAPADSSVTGVDKLLTTDFKTVTVQQVADANESKATDIASAATTDVGAAEAAFVHVTGTTTITALGTAQAGARRIVVFDGALDLTHNATSLILPTGANITTAAGDVAMFVSEGSGNWRCVDYTRADGTPLAGGGGGGGMTNPMTTAGDIIIGGSSGAPQRLAAGTDSQVLTMVSGAPAWAAPGGGSLTGFTASLETSSPNNTVNISVLLASGGTTNQDVVVQPKGTGAFLLQKPDGTATGGNKRGTYAVDLQTSTRTAATQVASGASSFAAGQRCTSSGNTAVAIGYGATSSGSRSIALGENATASDDYAVALGRNTNATASYAVAISNATASGQESFAIQGGNASAPNSISIGSGSISGGTGALFGWATGRYANAKGVYGFRAHASGNFSGALAGSAQYGRITLRGQASASTSPVTVTSDQSSAAATNQLVLLNNSAVACRGRAVFRNTTSGDTKMVEFDCLIKRGASAAATSIVGTPNIDTVHEDAGASTWALTLAADTTNGALQVQMAGDASNVTRFVCVVETTEVM